MNVGYRGAALTLLLICTLPSCARSAPPPTGPKGGLPANESSSQSLPPNESSHQSLPASLPKATSTPLAPSHATPLHATAPSPTGTSTTSPSAVPQQPQGASQDPAATPSNPLSAPASPPGSAKSLPKLELKAVGLHVGGGPNDAATRRAFGAPIELQFPELMRCYRSVETPKALAIFGVDLVVPPGEGRARVRKIRTTLKGKSFQSCMQNALEMVRFRNPLKKPTSVSYSVRFALIGLDY